MLCISHNPLSMVIEVANELWPDIEAKINWVSQIEPPPDGETVYGRTTYPDDGGAPVIDIVVNLPLEAACEVLAHEIAHVVAGADEDHGPVWEDASDLIHERFIEKVAALCDAAQGGEVAA